MKDLGERGVNANNVRINGSFGMLSSGGTYVTTGVYSRRAGRSETTPERRQRLTIRRASYGTARIIAHGANAAIEFELEPPLPEALGANHIEFWLHFIVESGETTSTANKVVR